MIEFTKSYKTADGNVFGTIEDAQLHEIETLLGTINGASFGPAVVARHVLDSKDVIIDILTTTPNSKPKARATHGGKKTRKTVVTDAATNAATTVNT